MNLKHRISRTLASGGITLRFSLGVGLLVALIVTVALTGYLSIIHIRHTENAIRTSTEIRRLVLEMDRGMERARHLHAEFYLQYPVVGLSEAHERFAQPSVRQVAKVISISQHLKDLIARSPVSEALRKTRVDLNLYLSSAKRFADTSIQSVELVTELAAPGRGLEAQIAAHIAALRPQITTQSLEPYFDQILTNIQQYRISRKRHLMQSAFNAAFELRLAAGKDPRYADKQRREIAFLMDRLTDTAEKILSVDSAIKAKFNDFALQANAVEPVSATLIELANAEVRLARARIARAHNTAVGIMAGITLVGLVLAIWIAVFLNSSITKRILRLADSADRLRKGHLDVCVEAQGADELSQLARTFNHMAARVNELVGHLEHKVAQRTAELAASEARFRDLFEHSSSGVAVYEPADNGEDFVFKDVNKAVERIEKVRREEIIGKKVTDVFPGVAEFGLLEVMRRVARTGKSALHPASFYKDERLQGWRESSVYCLPSGEIVTVYNDLTAQKQAELEKQAMEAKLQHSQKMEAVGVLAGGVAHDFNNILSIMLGNAELALDSLPEGRQEAANVMEIITAGLRAKEVIHQLLSFSRHSDVRMEPVSIIPIVKETLSLMRASIPANIEIRQNIVRGKRAVLADPTQIHQVLINLCTNAAHAMEATGGVLRVDICEIEVDADNAARYPGALSGNYIRLIVADTGCGISEDLQCRIFDPYFTTKEMGKGTGMGLAVVHGIVKNHGGTIAVHSRSGQGSTFTILLPATQSQAQDITPKREAIPRGSERILLVDDEASLLKSWGTILERLGYHVTSTSIPTEAIEMFESAPNSFDVVITDMSMPMMTGAELSAMLHRMRPNLPIILCSGYSDAMDAQKAAAMGIYKYMEKPFKTHHLAQVLREILDAS